MIHHSVSSSINTARFAPNISHFN